MFINHWIKQLKTKFAQSATKEQNNPKPDKGSANKILYWFEKGEPVFQEKPWFRDFLISLDNNKGNLATLSEQGDEDISQIIAFIKKDKRLCTITREIISKYSVKRDKKYFGKVQKQVSESQEPKTTTKRDQEAATPLRKKRQRTSQKKDTINHDQWSDVRIVFSIVMFGIFTIVVINISVTIYVIFMLLAIMFGIFKVQKKGETATKSRSIGKLSSEKSDQLHEQTSNSLLDKRYFSQAMETSVKISSPNLRKRMYRRIVLRGISLSEYLDVVNAAQIIPEPRIRMGYIKEIVHEVIMGKEVDSAELNNIYDVLLPTGPRKYLKSELAKAFGISSDSGRYTKQYNNRQHQKEQTKGTTNASKLLDAIRNQDSKRVSAIMKSIKSDSQGGNQGSAITKDGIISLFLERTQRQLGEAEIHLLKLNSSVESVHYTEFTNELKGIIQFISAHQNYTYYDAAMKLFKESRANNIRYKVANLERNVEFESGIAEAYRYAIQTLINVIEYTPYLAAIKLPDSSGNGGDRTIKMIGDMFYKSPFGYDTIMTDSLRGEYLEDRIRFRRKSRSNLRIGGNSYWQ